MKSSQNNPSEVELIIRFIKMMYVCKFLANGHKDEKRGRDQLKYNHLMIMCSIKLYEIYEKPKVISERSFNK